MKNNFNRISAALRKNPENVQLLVETAKYFIRQNNPIEFLNLFEEIYEQVEVEKLPPQIIFSIGMTCFDNQRWKQACKLLSILWMKDKFSPPLINPFSYALIKEGRLSDAQGVLEEALNGQLSGDPEILTNLAIVLSEKGNYDCAEKIYLNVIKIRPNEFLAYYNFGGFLMQLGREEEAIKCYEECLRIAPHAPEARNRLDSILYTRRSDITIHARGTQNSSLASIYSSIEQEDWNKAVTLINDNSNQIDHIRKNAAILELPRKAQNQISNQDFYDPKLQVKRVQIFEQNDPILIEISSLIKNEESLIWNRAGKPTRNGFQSHEILANANQNQSLDLLLEELIQVVSERRSEAIESITGRWTDPISLSGWAVVIKNGGYQKRHIHPEAKYSGVFYVKVPPISSKIAENKGDLYFFGAAGSIPLKLEPIQGSVITFPSYIPHETVPLVNTEERICIAFNVQ